MASETCCKAGKPLRVDHVKQGTFKAVDGVDYYHVGAGSSAIIVIPDVFGFSENQIFAVCDQLADAGFNVAAPDFFDGKPLTRDRWPPKEGDDIMGWIMRVGAMDKVEAHMNPVMGALKEQGVQKFAILGFCWGGCRSMQLAKAPFVAAACVHGGFHGQDAAIGEGVQVPVIVLQAHGDTMEELQAVVEKKPFADKCKFKRFDDQVHGFLAARGEWDKPEVGAAAQEAMGLLTEFFKQNL